MDQENLAYYQLREREELAAAQNAASDCARRVHQELALRYADLLGSDTNRIILFPNPQAAGRRFRPTSR